MGDDELLRRSRDCGCGRRGVQASRPEAATAESGGDAVDAGVCVCECAFSVLATAGWHFGASGHGDAENVALLMSIVLELNAPASLKCRKLGVLWIRM